MRMNARLMFSASPKPTASAMRSTGRQSSLCGLGQIGAERSTTRGVWCQSVPGMRG